MKTYYIAQAPTAVKLTTEVDRMLEKGWELVGGPFWSQGVYAERNVYHRGERGEDGVYNQALIRGKPTSTWVLI